MAVIHEVAIQRLGQDALPARSRSLIAVPAQARDFAHLDQVGPGGELQPEHPDHECRAIVPGDRRQGPELDGVGLTAVLRAFRMRIDDHVFAASPAIHRALLRDPSGSDRSRYAHTTAVRIAEPRNEQVGL
jgi:hypothetical protein